MRKFFLGFVFTLVIVGCGVQTDIKPDTFSTVPASERMKEIGARNVPEVRAIFAGNEADGLQPLALGPNLFDNAGFENGLAGWTGCEAGAVQASTDVFAGSGALQINPNNCFFRSAEVSAGQELVLSCYIKVRNGTGWTGMGMSFDDSNYNALVAAPTVVATGNSYVRYETRGVAPSNTQYLSMWIFSENDVVVDNCSLAVDSDSPLPPPPPSGDNLLENAGFESLNASNKPNNWSKGCSGTWSTTSGRNGRGLQVSGGACIDQGLSATEATSLSGNSYSYSCYAKNTGGYASISIFLNGQPSSKVIPVSNSFQAVEITGTAPSSTSSAFVSIYSEGNLTIDDCILTTEGTPPPPPSDDNLLENATFETLNAANKPTNWIKGCGGSWATASGRSGRGMSVNGGACIDQSLSSVDVSAINGNSYNYSCYAKNSGGYASISIFLNGQAMNKVIPVSNNFQRVELSGNAASNINNGFVSIYSEANLVVDDCVLSVGDVSPPPPPSGTCSGNASYTFTYTNSWTAATHPYQFTDDPHFSDFVGTNHNSDVTLWETGSLATEGVKNVAELGNNSQLESEINSVIGQGDAETLFIGDFLNPVLAGSQRSFQIGVSPSYSQVSVVSMLAPSPDWFIGLNGLELCQNGQWIESVSRDAFVYDSGTDDGVIYNSANAVSNPRQPITRLNALPFVVNGQTVPVGTFTLTKN